MNSKRLTREQAEDILPLITAYVSGETIQVNVSGAWADLEMPTFDGPAERYRIKPKEEFVPYDVNNCPAGLRVLVKSDPTAGLQVVYPITANSVQVGQRCVTYTDLFHKYYRPDGSPCGVRKES